MNENHTHNAGDFCWIELATTDAAGAKKFYNGLLNWEAKDTPAGPDMIYTQLYREGKNVGAIYQMNQEQVERGIPVHWKSYISVNNVDETVEKAKALGAQINYGPIDVMEAGKMAVIQDPTGAVIAVWEPKEHAGVEMKDAAGSLCWNELMTRDAEKAKDFYTELFDWESKSEDMGGFTYTSFFNNGVQHCGMIQMDGEEWGDMNSHWLPYITVEDCDADVAKVEALGGKVCVPPTDIPKVGRFALVTDPQGAAINIIKLVEVEA
jgi:uncharacterized protein